MSADPAARTIDVKKPIKLDGFHPTAVFAHSFFSTDEQAKSILRVADWIAANGIDGPGDYRAARDLLLAYARLRAGQSLAKGDGESIVQTAASGEIGFETVRTSKT